MYFLSALFLQRLPEFEYGAFFPITRGLGQNIVCACAYHECTTKLENYEKFPLFCCITGIVRGNVRAGNGPSMSVLIVGSQINK